MLLNKSHILPVPVFARARVPVPNNLENQEKSKDPRGCSFTITKVRPNVQRTITDFPKLWSEYHVKYPPNGSHIM